MGQAKPTARGCSKQEGKFSELSPQGDTAPVPASALLLCNTQAGYMASLWEVGARHDAGDSCPCLMAPHVPAATPHAECKHTFPKLHDCASGLNGKINMQCRTVSVEGREDPERDWNGAVGVHGREGAKNSPPCFLTMP